MQCRRKPRRIGFVHGGVSKPNAMRIAGYASETALLAGREIRPRAWRTGVAEIRMLELAKKAHGSESGRQAFERHP
jgi:hypothetical protein